MAYGAWLTTPDAYWPERIEWACSSTVMDTWERVQLLLPLDRHQRRRPARLGDLQRRGHRRLRATGQTPGLFTARRDADRRLRQGDQWHGSRCRRLHDLRSHRQLPGHRCRVASWAPTPADSPNESCKAWRRERLGRPAERIRLRREPRVRSHWWGKCGCQSHYRLAQQTACPGAGSWNGQFLRAGYRCGWSMLSPRAVWPGGSLPIPAILTVLAAPIHLP